MIGRGWKDWQAAFKPREALARTHATHQRTRRLLHAGRHTRIARGLVAEAGTCTSHKPRIQIIKTPSYRRRTAHVDGAATDKTLTTLMQLTTYQCPHRRRQRTSPAYLSPLKELSGHHVARSHGVEASGCMAAATAESHTCEESSARGQHLVRIRQGGKRIKVGFMHA